jgi:hypothetical protein
MIRPVLYVDLPGIIYALDRRARLVGRPLATFLCAPRYEETRSGLANLLGNLSPVRATARTWICEEHWRLLGVAQGRARPDATSWDLVYLASMTGEEAQAPSVLRSLLEYAVNAAMMHGQQRLFAQIAADDAALAIFHQVGFQRYAEELLYVRESPTLDGLPEPERGLGMPTTTLRRWRQEDVWGLSQLHAAVTPRRVQVAELLGSDELARQFVPRTRTWRIPGAEPRDETYVVDLGSHLAGWVRVRSSWAGVPHQLWLMVHPDHAEVAPDILRFALGRLCENGTKGGTRSLRQPVICQIRDYEGGAIDGLRRAGFIHTDTKDILVRHLTLRAFSDLAIPGVEKRISYGVEGLGTVRSSPFQPTRELSTCNTRSRMTSTSSWPHSRRASRRPLRPIPSAGN